MSNPLSSEWCRLTWQTLLYLTAAYNRLDSERSVRVKDAGWQAETGDEGGKPEIGIGFEAKPANKPGPFYLWIGLWFNENDVESDRPIWVQVVKNDRQVWERLKGEFKEALVYDTDEYWAVGLEWTLSSNATNGEVRSAGEELAGRISRVLLPHLS